MIQQTVTSEAALATGIPSRTPNSPAPRRPGTPAPLAIGVEVAGALLGLGRQASYEALWRNALPTLDLGGRRKYVSVARLAELAGREITAADIARAEGIVAARKHQAESVAS